MSTSNISLKESNLFRDIVIDYYDQKESLQPSYNFAPNLSGLKEAIAQRENYNTDRKLLVDVLSKQYKEASQNQLNNLNSLLDKNTFTVTTGHQLNLFTGPLYFVIKIISVINLSKKLNLEHPGKKFIPIYWMASEDHDFAEINHTYVFGKKVEWDSEASGAVGELELNSIENTILQLKEILGEEANSDTLVQDIETAYKQGNLAKATHYLVNKLFGSTDLLIIDANDAQLKRAFSSIIKRDIIEQNSHDLIEKTKETLLGDYKIQVNPRGINFFYLHQKQRERIVFEKNTYQVLNTDWTFTQKELEDEIDLHPERFSPNVVMRPLYQECILPNITYVGGPSELAYWLELKSTFDKYKVFYPNLLLRDHVLFVDANSQKKIEKLGLEIHQIFSDVEELIKSYVKNHSEKELNLKEETKAIHQIFEQILEKAYKIDPTLSKMVKGEQVKSIHHIKAVEQKIAKAEKQNFETEIAQIRSLNEKLFPGGGLAERKENFLSFYWQNRESFFELLYKNIDCLQAGIKIIS